MYNAEIGILEGQLAAREIANLLQLSEQIKQSVSKRIETTISIWEVMFSNLNDFYTEESAETVSDLINFVAPPKSLSLEKFWVVESSYENVDASKLPFLPHFDIERTTKIMVYLSDVDTNDGPMFIAKNVSPTQFEKRRCGVTLKGQNVVTNTDLIFEPLIGPAGHFHVFDTNIPHYAGNPGKGGSRRVVRLDFVHPRQ